MDTIVKLTLDFLKQIEYTFLLYSCNLLSANLIQIPLFELTLMLFYPRFLLKLILYLIELSHLDLDTAIHNSFLLTSN